MDKLIDTRHLENVIETQGKMIGRHTEALKQTEKTLTQLIRQLEKLTTVISTGNELRKHGGTV